jgi:molybdate transport system substrate-binding protein
MIEYASAAELRLYAAAGVKALIIELAAEFEKASGHSIVPMFDTAGAAEKRFLADGDATFLITSTIRISDAERCGKLKNGAVHAVGDTVGGFAAPPGQAKPDISTPEKLKVALLAAPRIAFSDPARGATVGAHFMRVIEALGVREDVLKKSTLAKDGVETMRLLLAGKADLGVTQLSEVVQADRSALIGPFPREFDLATKYSLWYRTDAAPAAKAFVQLVTGPLGRAKLVRHGLRPSPD